ncbi:MAG: archaeosine biosynthesis radical SAM protein RaSEA [Candidatus Heimdallarchaeota archaeon]|nr:archaeosine biosynthesis radical SAM protein RaSEA [Candidatus Heimdallarchaeota archaeon]MDH5644431.1 archaeosine biosynthesis radical SAM protein RaSEA [Candidatus Heimdallarchaeota archaeon]
MDTFTSFIGELRVKSNQERKLHHDKIINWIDEYPMKDGKRGLALTMILPTKGCKYAMAKHGGCSMCTLPMDNPLQPTETLIKSLPQRCVDIFNAKGGKEKFVAVKFYTSGSFLDRWELPIEVRDNILRTFAELVDEITIETRCEFVTRKQLTSIIDIIPPSKLIVAIGQETTDDEINKRSINKGHTLNQFKRAVNILRTLGIQTKGYVLLKPIFLSELASVEDAIRTIETMKSVQIQHVSINPAYIGKMTLMDFMFKYREYQPPWLWSVLIVTKKAKEILGSSVRLISDPVAAGSERGPSNCKECNPIFKEALKEFSATQDVGILNKLACDCYEIYKSTIYNEILSNGMGIDSIRY